MSKAVAFLVVSPIVAAIAMATTLAAPSPAFAAPTTFRISGAGWGHGVGMSQNGAYAMANAGYSANQIVAHYYTGVGVSAVNDDRNIRVNVGHAVGTVLVRTQGPKRGGGPVSVQVKGTTTNLPANTVIKLAAAGRQTKVSASSASGNQQLGSGRQVNIRWRENRQVQVAAGARGYGSSLYRRGSLNAATVGGKLEVVNILRVHDDYLNGIAEVSSSWPMAALQAQAIAARSYALARLSGIRAGCRCNVDNGFGGYSDQTFFGYAREKDARWRQAVASTNTSPGSGLTLVYRGQPIASYYSASSGGRTENSEDVWGTAQSWARSVDDHWALTVPGATWSVTKSQAQLAGAFGLTNVVSVAVTSRYTSTSAKSVTAVAANGSRKTISGSAFASRLGLKSRWVTGIS